MKFVDFNEELVELGILADNKETAIKILCGKLLANGYVKDSFYENVLKREEKFPTGLPSIIPMAICHTESEHVHSSAIALGTLKEPVSFQEMGTPERIVKAEIIFVIAMKNPKDQVPWLRKMMTVLKDEKVLSTVRDASNKKEVVNYLNEIFS